MNRILATALVICVSAIAAPVLAQNNNEAAKGGAISGGAAGAVGGALIGGPIGAVVGGIAGAAVGATAGSLTPEDRVYARQYVTSRKDARSEAFQEQVVVGQPMPQRIKVYPIEGNPRLGAYNYAHVNERYYLVDSAGRVVQVIE